MSANTQNFRVKHGLEVVEAASFSNTVVVAGNTTLNNASLIVTGTTGLSVNAEGQALFGNTVTVSNGGIVANSWGSANAVTITAANSTTTAAISVNTTATYITGNLVITGTTQTQGSATLEIGTGEIILLAGVQGTPLSNGAIQVNRGSSNDVKILWDETDDNWKFSNDGVNYYPLRTYSALVYEFDTNTTTSADPGPGKVRFNSGTYSLATELVLDLVEYGGTTVTNYLASLDDSTSSNKCILTFRSSKTQSNFVSFLVTAAINTSTPGAYRFTISHLAGASSFANGEILFLEVSGIVGNLGAQGAQGVQGAQGRQGAQGFQGEVGVQGAQGVTGAPGAQGPQGFQGVQGVLGAQGPQGFQGFQGVIGVQGAQGVTGAPGAQGSQGNQGVQGAVGAQGAQGFQGVTGATVIGPPGAQGAQGHQGIQGAQGVQGAVGAQGTVGAQGITGSPGAQGAQGAQGFQGVQGATGAQGAAGPQGSQGVQGAVGAQGATGAVSGSNANVNSWAVGTAAHSTTGEIRAAAQIIAYYSDARLKENVVEIENALDKIDSIRGVYYNQNSVAEQYGYKEYRRKVGVIAQEVQAVLPEVVTNAPFDMDSAGNSISGQNYLTVQYDKIVPLLVQAIKELKNKVDKK